ncbi:unnamed protein product, partial [Callosobruchus maculatus]
YNLYCCFSGRTSSSIERFRTTQCSKVIIVDREHDNHREVKSIGRCEVVQSFVYLGRCEVVQSKMRFDGAFNRHVWP